MIAVHGSAGRREDDARPLVQPARGLEQVEGAADVHVGVEHRIGDAAPHVHLRREVRDRVEAPLADERRCLGRTNVETVKGRGRRQVRLLPGRQIVDDVHGPSVAQQRVRRVRSYEAGSTRD